MSIRLGSILNFKKVSATPTEAAASDETLLYSKSADSRLYIKDASGVEHTISDTRLVRVVAPGGITLSGTQTIDGVAVVAGDRVLCIAQGVFSGNAQDNGIWVVAAGAWARAADSNTTAEMAGASVIPTEGRWAGRTFRSLLKSTDTLGTTAFVWQLDGPVHGNSFEVPYNNNRGGLTTFDTVTKQFKVHDGSSWYPVDPPGKVSEFAGFAAPAGYLMCDGTAYSRSTYSALWNVISYQFTGTGASGQKVITTSDTANARVGMYVDGNGVGTGNYITAIAAGASITLKNNLTATLSGTNNLRLAPWGVGDGSTTFNVPDHRGFVAAGQDGTTEFPGLGLNYGERTHLLTIAEMPTHHHVQNLGGAWSTVNNVAGSGVIGNTNNSNTQDTGGNGAHNNVQPTVGMNYIIKT